MALTGKWMALRSTSLFVARPRVATPSCISRGPNHLTRIAWAGIIVYNRYDFRVRKIGLHAVSVTLEALAVSVPLSRAPMTLLTGHRPGSAPPTAAFLAEFSTFLEHLPLDRANCHGCVSSAGPTTIIGSVSASTARRRSFVSRRTQNGYGPHSGAYSSPELRQRSTEPAFSAEFYKTLLRTSRHSRFPSSGVPSISHQLSLVEEILPAQPRSLILVSAPKSWSLTPYL